MPENNPFIYEKLISLEDEYNTILDKYKLNINQESTNCKKSEKNNNSKKSNDYISIIKWIRFSKLNSLLALPFIYGMIFPLIFLDIMVSLYQAVCFRLFKIPRVKKSDYMALERHNLPYLNFIEKIHCDYCGYANGLIAFCREVLARTEQYFCPIKHAKKILGEHERYAFFLNYGEAEDYHKKLLLLRETLSKKCS
jgi:hypothetical protein